MPQHKVGSELLGPIETVLRTTFDTPAGLAPGLVVQESEGWFPASSLVDGSRLPGLLEWAHARWRASPHAAATLVWKYYSYWSVLPAVLGWAAARRVPLMRAADVLVRHDGQDGPQAWPTIGLRRSLRTAVLPTDPLAGAAGPYRIEVVADEARLLAALRTALLDEHLDPLMRTICSRVRIAGRPLRGSVGSGVAHGLLRAAAALPGPVGDDVSTVLAAFGMDDLVRLVPGPGGTPRVQRRTCCLAFTLPEPKICGGCCLPAARTAGLRSTGPDRDGGTPCG